MDGFDRVLVEAVGADAGEEDGEGQCDVCGENLLVSFGDEPCDKTGGDEDQEWSDGHIEVSAQGDATEEDRGDGHEWVAMQDGGTSCGVVLHRCTRYASRRNKIAVKTIYHAMIYMAMIYRVERRSSQAYISRREVR